MSHNNKSMQYLSVNTEDYLLPLRPAHRRISRSISPGLDTMESLDECESQHDLRKTASSKSLLLLHKFTSSDSNLSTTAESTTSTRKAIYKSTESLCFGRPKKRLHRQMQISEIYRPRPRCNTDPVETDSLRRKKLPIPLLTVPPETSNSECSSLSSSVAPTPLLGRKHHQRRSTALSSLIEQALKVTTASVGLKSAKTDERLTQQATKTANDDNVKRRLSSDLLA
ncbi:uncharacterized protein LOC110119060 [Ceratitis capitata]|nr:uncharacterized protein LOC110119060 [Ceratitis capitata]